MKLPMTLQPVTIIARYTALEALRTRYIWLVVALCLAGLGISQFVGSLAITETQASQAAITAALSRLAAVLLLILFVTTSVHRDFSDKSVELMLSLPLPRAGLYVGKLAGYALVAVFTALPLTLLMLLLAPFGASLAWGISLLLELLLVCAMSLLFAFAFSQATAAVAVTLLFYLLGRSIAAMQLMAHAPMHDSGELSARFMTGVVDVMAYLLPDLDRFAPGHWLVYPDTLVGQLQPLLVQTLIYLGLLAGVALFDLYRKNF